MTSRFFESFIGLVGLSVACGGGVAGSSGASGGGSCSIPAGTYTQHFTLEPGGTDCVVLADQTLTFRENQTFSDSSSTSTTGDGGVQCTTHVDASTCTATSHCTSSVGNFTSTISTSITYAGATSSGKETITMTSSGKTTTCTYDIAMTKV